MTEGSGIRVADAGIVLVGVGVSTVEDALVAPILEVGCVDEVDAVTVGFAVVVFDRGDDDPLGVVMSAEEERLESGDGLRGAEPPNRRNAAAAAASRGAVACKPVELVSFAEVGEIGFEAEELGVASLVAPAAGMVGATSVAVALNPAGLFAGGASDPFVFDVAVG